MTKIFSKTRDLVGMYRVHDRKGKEYQTAIQLDERAAAICVRALNQAASRDDRGDIGLGAGYYIMASALVAAGLLDDAETARFSDLLVAGGAR